MILPLLSSNYMLHPNVIVADKYETLHSSAHGEAIPSNSRSRWPTHTIPRLLPITPIRCSEYLLSSRLVRNYTYRLKYHVTFKLLYRILINTFDCLHKFVKCKANYSYILLSQKRSCHPERKYKSPTSLKNLTRYQTPM